MTRPSDRAIAQAFWEWRTRSNYFRAKYSASIWIEERASELDATAAPVVVGGDVFRRALSWLASGDTGMSSETIAYHMLGVDAEVSHPYDPADLGRCLRLLELFPEWKPRIGEMANRSTGWAALVPEWDRLSAMMADEVGIDWSKGRNATRTYNAMRAALTAALAGD